MATPKFDPDTIAKLRDLAASYREDHETGGYAAKTTRDRGNHAERFVDYLEGRYDPTADYGKRIAP